MITFYRYPGDPLPSFSCIERVNQNSNKNTPRLHNDSAGLLNGVKAAGASGLGERLEHSLSLILGFDRVVVASAGVRV